jgi:tRNA (cytidine/uridine-2'-O-)-methyltransferase
VGGGRYNRIVNIVLYEPDIPGNTGNVGRTCLATGSPLHLVGKLGFSLDDTHVKRSGLDYWDKVQVIRHKSWEEFLIHVGPAPSLYFFSKKAKKDFWKASFEPQSYLIFGCETTGLPKSIHEKYENRLFRIPMIPHSVRSLNLSTSVGVVLYEALRQTGLPALPAGRQAAGQELN